MALIFLSQRAGRAVRWWLLGVLLLGGGGARAELRFDVFVGYDGTVRESAWFPVTCEVFNDGPPINGFIELAASSFGQGQTQRLPIELPTGTTKRVFIPAFSASRYPQSWDVRLVTLNGKVLEESIAARPQRSVGWETKLVGALPRTAAGMVALRSIKRNQPDMQPTAVRFQPAMFPDNPLLLEGLDAIYLNSEIAVGLRQSQATALLTWLNAGGHLIVGIEQVNDVTAVPWLRSVLPVEPAEIVGVAVHPELQDWVEQGTTVTNFTLPTARRNNVPAPVDQGNLQRAAFEDLRADPVFEAAEIRVVTGKLRDGVPLVSAGTHPLLVTANRGLGRLTVLMFSPEREPFKGWKNLPTFWTKLAEVPLELYLSSDYHPGYGFSVDGLFGALIDSRQIHKLPIGWLLILLLVYLVVIGPVDRLWLKKINRPMLTWITFPCYVAFFSGLIYLIGYKLRAGESEYNELHVVDVLPRGEQSEWRGRTYASIYSPSNARYPLRSELRFATLRGEYLASRGGETSDKGTLLHTGDNFKADVFVPVWTSQLYLSDWWHSGAPPLTATLQPANDGWTLTVENRLPTPVASARLAVGNLIYEVGEIRPGAPRTLRLQGGEQIRSFVQNRAQEYRGPVQQRQYAFGHHDSGRIEDAATATVVASLLGEVEEVRQDVRFVTAPGMDVSPVLARGGAVLFAWTPGSAPVATLNQTKAKRSAANTLWRVPIAMRP